MIPFDPTFHVETAATAGDDRPEGNPYTSVHRGRLERPLRRPEGCFQDVAGGAPARDHADPPLFGSPVESARVPGTDWWAGERGSSTRPRATESEGATPIGSSPHDGDPTPSLLRPGGPDQFLAGKDAGDVEPYEVTWVEDLLARVPAQEHGEYLVDDLLPAGELVILNARPKAGKGLLSIDLVCSIALGESFLGHAVRQGPALYAAAEENLGEIADRIRRRLGSDSSGPHQVGVMDISGSGPRDLRLERREDLASLARSIQLGGFVVVVIDTLREVHGGHEDVADEMAPLLKPLRNLAHTTGVTIILNHHQNKAGESRGSTAIAGACDTTWSFQRPQGGSGASDRTLPPHGTLVVEGRRVPLQALDIEFGEDGRWRRSSEAAARSASRATSPAATEVMRVLPRDGGMTVKQIVEATKLGDSAVRAFLGGSSDPLPAGVARVGSGKRNDPCRYLLETAA